MNIRLPIDLVKKAQQEGWTKALTYLALLKRNKTTYYNFTYQSVSKLLGCSKSTLKRNLDILRHKDLCYFQNGNLCLVGTKKLQARFKHKKLAQIELIKGKEKLSIEYVLVSEKLTSQEYYIDKLAELKRLTKLISTGKYIPKLQLKRFKKLRLLFKNRSMQRNYQCLSVFGFGKSLFNHYTTGYRKRNQLKELGLISVEQKRNVIVGKTHFEFKLMRKYGNIPQYAKYYKGIISIPLASEIHITNNYTWGQ
jgi:hypothetical protein